MQIYDYGDKNSDTVLIQMVDDHDMNLMDSEFHLIEELGGRIDFRLIAVKVDSWNDDLSPWESPAVFGSNGFGGQAETALKKLMDEVIEPLRSSRSDSLHLYIGGYSLAGIFALWSVYRTDIFAGCAAASPSVWFPGFAEFMANEEIKTGRVYLSLGDKEEKTKNPVMGRVGDAIRSGYDLLKDKIDVTLEWNEGNHFREPDLRTAKGFAWLLRK